MMQIPQIEPFQFIRSTAFSERVQLANKINEIIDGINGLGEIPDLQAEIDAVKGTISQIQTELEDTNSDVSGLTNQVNTLISEVNGLLKEVISEVSLDSPGYGQVRVKVIHEDETETASNALQIPVIVDGGISLISGTTARSFKIRYITADGVTHTTNDFVIPEGGGGTDVTVTSVTILEGDSDNSFKFEIGLSDGSEIQSNSYPFPAASELTPATTSQLGGVKIGANVTVQADGTISVDLSPYALKSEIPDVSQFVTAEDVAADYQPKGDYLTEIPIGGTAIGGVKNGGNVTIDAEGKMTAPTTPAYTLPVASANTLGGVKIGSGVTVGEDGTISVTAGSNIVFIQQTLTSTQLWTTVNKHKNKIINLSFNGSADTTSFKASVNCPVNPSNAQIYDIPCIGKITIDSVDYNLLTCDFNNRIKFWYNSDGTEKGYEIPSNTSLKVIIVATDFE